MFHRRIEIELENGELEKCSANKGSEHRKLEVSGTEVEASNRIKRKKIEPITEACSKKR